MKIFDDPRRSAQVNLKNGIRGKAAASPSGGIVTQPDRGTVIEFTAEA